MTTFAAGAQPPLHRRLASWTSDHAILFMAALVFAYIGMHVFVTVYYLLFQVYDPVTQLWHELIPNDYLRHAIRNVGEGLFGGIFAQAIVWNHAKAVKAARKPLKALGKLEVRSRLIANLKDDIRLSWVQLLLSPVFIILYAIPGFLIAFGLVLLARHTGLMDSLTHGLSSAVQTHLTPQTAPWYLKAQAFWTQNWDQKLMGYLAAFFWGRRPAKGLFDDLQYWFAEHRVRHNLPLRWWHLPNFRARYREIQTSGEVRPLSELSRGDRIRRKLMVITARGGVALSVVFAIAGWAILTFIAK